MAKKRSSRNRFGVWPIPRGVRIKDNAVCYGGDCEESPNDERAGRERAKAATEKPKD